MSNDPRTLRLTVSYAAIPQSLYPSPVPFSPSRPLPLVNPLLSTPLLPLNPSPLPTTDFTTFSSFLTFRSLWDLPRCMYDLYQCILLITETYGISLILKNIRLYASYAHDLEALNIPPFGLNTVKRKGTNVAENKRRSDAPSVQSSRRNRREGEGRKRDRRERGRNNRSPPFLNSQNGR